MNIKKQFKEGLITNNPVLVQLIGMCATMAITTTLFNGIGMGIAATIVLTCSNAIISLLRKVILLIPLILLLPRLGIFKNAAFAVFFAEPVADTLAVCTTAAMFFTRFGKLTAGAENA